MPIEWTCDNCGQTGNLGRYCVKCGTEHPMMRKIQPEPDGRMKEIRISYWSSGMMMNSGGHTISSVIRQDDGSYVLNYDVLNPMQDKGTVSVFSVDPSDFERLEGMVIDNKMSSWSGLKEKTPVHQVFDFSDSYTMLLSRFITGDTGLVKSCSVNLRAAEMNGFETEVKAVADLIDSLRKPQNLISVSETVREGIGAQPSLMNNGHMGMVFLKDLQGESESEGDTNLTLDPIVDVSRDMPLMTQDQETWICPECLCSTNTGKFCTQCGYPRPNKEGKS